MVNRRLPLARLGKAFAVGAVLLFALSLLTVAAPKQAAAAEPVPLIVYGYVRDTLGQIVVGASVTITDVTTGDSFGPFITDEFGQYQYSIPEVNWTTGDTIRADATYGATSGFSEDTAPITDFPMMELDVTLSNVIPEFGSVIGASVAAIFAGAVAIVVIGRPRKQ